MEVSRYEIFVYAMMLWAAVVVGFPTTMHLERAAPRTNQLTHVLARDRARHAKLLNPNGVHFPVEGSFEQALYYVRVQVGSPPRDFHLQIDTGSDLTWISGSGCKSCSKFSNLPIELSFYDPNSSSTALMVSCSDHRCEAALEKSEFAGCFSKSGLCGFRLEYADKSTTSGFLVFDRLHFTVNVRNSSTMSYSAPILFGCSTFVDTTGSLTGTLVDGIIGFGQGATSIISQLAREGATRKAFGHCFSGGNRTGSSLVLGDTMEQGIVYTPLIASGSLYSINLQSITLDGQLLDIDPTVFAPPKSRGAIVDSGSTLSYLPTAAYYPFLNAITAFAVLRAAQPFLSRVYQEHCFNFTSSVNDTFPRVTFNFAGGASLLLSPLDYLRQSLSDSPVGTLCMGVHISGDEVPVLGDLFMRDKLFVYDLEAQRIGWVDHDCSLPVNISGFHGSRSSHGGRSSQRMRHLLIFSSIVVIICIVLVGGILFFWYKFQGLSRPSCFRFPFC